MGLFCRVVWGERLAGYAPTNDGFWEARRVPSFRCVAALAGRYLPRHGCGVGVTTLPIRFDSERGSIARADRLLGWLTWLVTTFGMISV